MNRIITASALAAAAVLASAVPAAATTAPRPVTHTYTCHSGHGCSMLENGVPGDHFSVTVDAASRGTVTGGFQSWCAPAGSPFPLGSGRFGPVTAWTFAGNWTDGVKTDVCHIGGGGSSGSLVVYVRITITS